MNKIRLHILCVISLFVIAIFFILISSRTCEVYHKKSEFTSNFPFYETKNLKICKIVDQLLDVKEKIPPGGGYFGSHSRWAKLIVHMPYKEKNKYDVDIYYSYNKDGTTKLDSCNIFLVNCSNGVTYQTDKGWYFSDDLIRDLCYQIAIEKSLPMPVFVSERPTPSPFTLSYHSTNDTHLFKHVKSFF